MAHIEAVQSTLTLEFGGVGAAPIFETASDELERITTLSHAFIGILKHLTAASEAGLRWQDGRRYHGSAPTAGGLAAAAQFAGQASVSRE